MLSYSAKKEISTLFFNADKKQIMNHKELKGYCKTTAIILINSIYISKNTAYLQVKLKEAIIYPIKQLDNNEVYFILSSTMR